jgi:hypothetical protein
MKSNPRRPWLARGRWPVFLTGLASAGASLYIIWSDVQTSGFQMVHVLAPIIVLIAIVAGHYGAQHVRTIGGITCLVISVVASALVIYEGSARQAEQRDTKVLTAEAQQMDRLDLRAELMTQRKLVVPAKRAKAIACRQGREKSTACTKKTSDLAGLEQAVADIEKQLGETVVTPGDARYQQFASVLGVFGVDSSATKTNAQILDPLVKPIFFELVSIVLIGFGLGGHRQTKPHTTADTAQTSFAYDESAADFFRPYDPDGGAPIGPKRPVRPVTPVGPSGGQKSELLANLLTKLALGQTIPSQKAICQEYGIARSTLSDWLKSWEDEDLIPNRRKVGKCKMLTAA